MTLNVYSTKYNGIRNNKLMKITQRVQTTAARAPTVTRNKHKRIFGRKICANNPKITGFTSSTERCRNTDNKH